MHDKVTGGYRSARGAEQGTVFATLLTTARKISVRLGSGRQAAARVAPVDPRRDLALLTHPHADEPAVPMGDASAVYQGETLFAVGYPRADVLGGQDTTANRGIFAGRWQSRSGVWHVQTDTAISHGDSGGPLADAHGRLVGVVTFEIRNTEGLHFAVASDEVAAFLAGQGVAAAPPNAPAPAPASRTARPVLHGYAVSPRPAAPGAALAMTYELENPGTVPVAPPAARLPGRHLRRVAERVEPGLWDRVQARRRAWSAYRHRRAVAPAAGRRNRDARPDRCTGPAGADPAPGAAGGPHGQAEQYADPDGRAPAGHARADAGARDPDPRVVRDRSEAGHLEGRGRRQDALHRRAGRPGWDGIETGQDHRAQRRRGR
jgi:hypothetical protein